MDASAISPAGDVSIPDENWLLAEVLFGLNVAGALFLGGLLYALKNWAALKPADDSTYLCLRSMYRVIDFLGLQSQNPVATSAVQRQIPAPAGQFGAEGFILVTWLGLAAAAVLVLWLLRHTRIYRAILGPASVTILLFAAPVSFLYVSCLTPNWSHEPAVLAGSFLAQNLPLAVFVTEVACLGVLVSFFRGKQTAKWLTISFLVLHSAFWIYVLWSATRIFLFPQYARGLILLIFPLSAVECIFRRGRSLSHPHVSTENKPKVWHWALASGALVASGVVWSPARNIDLSRPQNVDSVTVELSRGPCFGTCAAYTVTAHGDGRVEFVGQVGRSRVQTTKSGTVAKEKVVEILQALDHVDFTALEGRAFFWAFDTPTVGVRASLDGRTKQVVSDASFGGSPDGRQARFVEAARKIDDILASSTWIKCEGQCEGSASSP
jgi:hypothetical protein